MKCEYCKNTFQTISSLNNHKKYAKYCLSIRNQSETRFQCEHCLYISTSKFRLETHKSTCIEMYKARVESLSHKNEELQYQLNEKNNENTRLCIRIEEDNRVHKELLNHYKTLSEQSRGIVEEIAKQPHTQNTTNQNINNTLLALTPLDLNNEERFSAIVNDHFDKNYLLDGQKGVARFAVEKLLRDENGKLTYVCTDPSRQIYRFKTIDGGIERDIKATKLTSALAKSILEKTGTITLSEITSGDSEVFLLYTTNFQDIKSLNEDNSNFRTELTSLTSV